MVNRLAGRAIKPKKPNMIKYPGHEAAMWTTLLGVGGAITVSSLLVSGSWVEAVLIAQLPIACMAIWLGIRPAKFIILGFLALLILRTCMKLVEDLQPLTLAKGMAYVYVSGLFKRWKGARLVGPAEPEEAFAGPTSPHPPR